MFRTMSHMILIVAVAATFAVTANNAHASRAQVEVEVVPATTPDAFAAQADEVRQSMEPDERYGDISATDRKAVEADMAKISGLLERVGSAEKLNSNEWVLLVNTQEHANALLTKNDGDRLICRYEKKTGTHFREKTCQTASEIENARRNAAQWAQEFQQHLVVPCDPSRQAC